MHQNRKMHIKILVKIDSSTKKNLLPPKEMFQLLVILHLSDIYSRNDLCKDRDK